MGKIWDFCKNPALYGRSHEHTVLGQIINELLRNGVGVQVATNGDVIQVGPRVGENFIPVIESPIGGPSVGCPADLTNSADIDFGFPAPSEACAAVADQPGDERLPEFAQEVVDFITEVAAAIDDWKSTRRLGQLLQRWQEAGRALEAARSVRGYDIRDTDPPELALLKARANNLAADIDQEMFGEGEPTAVRAGARMIVAGRELQKTADAIRALEAAGAPDLAGSGPTATALSSGATEGLPVPHSNGSPPRPLQAEATRSKAFELIEAAEADRVRLVAECMRQQADAARATPPTPAAVPTDRSTFNFGKPEVKGFAWNANYKIKCTDRVTGAKTTAYSAISKADAERKAMEQLMVQRVEHFRASNMAQQSEYAAQVATQQQALQDELDLAIRNVDQALAGALGEVRNAGPVGADDLVGGPLVSGPDGSAGSQAAPRGMESADMDGPAEVLPASGAKKDVASAADGDEVLPASGARKDIAGAADGEEASSPEEVATNSSTKPPMSPGEKAHFEGKRASAQAIVNAAWANRDLLKAENPFGYGLAVGAAGSSAYVATNALARIGVGAWVGPAMLAHSAYNSKDSPGRTAAKMAGAIGGGMALAAAIPAALPAGVAMGLWGVACPVAIDQLSPAFIAVGEQVLCRDRPEEEWKVGTVVNHTADGARRPLVRTSLGDHTWIEVIDISPETRVRCRDEGRAWRRGTCERRREGRTVVKADGEIAARTWDEVERLQQRSACFGVAYNDLGNVDLMDSVFSSMSSMVGVAWKPNYVTDDVIVKWLATFGEAKSAYDHVLSHLRWGSLCALVEVLEYASEDNQSSSGEFAGVVKLSYGERGLVDTMVTHAVECLRGSS